MFTDKSIFATEEDFNTQKDLAYAKSIKEIPQCRNNVKRNYHQVL